MAETLDRWHRRVVERPLLRTFTIVARVLLAIGFMPSGWVKVIGHRFTTLPVTDPVGHFFDGFFAAYGYYRFVGVAQLTAALLVLFPRTATLGAVIYFPIILNIFAITVSLGSAFAFTRVITGLMLLANIYLLLWDYDRWKGLVPFAGTSSRDTVNRHGTVATTFAFLAAALIGFAGVVRLHAAWLRHRSYVVPSVMIATGAAIGLLALLHSLRVRSGTLARDDHQLL